MAASDGCPDEEGTAAAAASPAAASAAASDDHCTPNFEHELHTQQIQMVFAKLKIYKLRHTSRDIHHLCILARACVHFVLAIPSHTNKRERLTLQQC